MSRGPRRLLALIVSLAIACAPITVVAGGCADKSMTSAAGHVHRTTTTDPGMHDRQAPLDGCAHCGVQHHCNGNHSLCSQGLALMVQTDYSTARSAGDHWISGVQTDLSSSGLPPPYHPPIPF